MRVTWPRLISVADKRPLGLQRVLSSGRSRAGLGNREIVRDTKADIFTASDFHILRGHLGSTLPCNQRHWIGKREGRESCSVIRVILHCFSFVFFHMLASQLSGVIPYRDRSMQTGRLPPRMRGLAQEGRLLCYRWFYLQDSHGPMLMLCAWHGALWWLAKLPAKWLATGDLRFLRSSRSPEPPSYNPPYN